MASDKLYNLKVNPGAKSSRFVVELKADSTENEAVEPMKKQAKPNMETRLEVKLDKLAAVDYGKIVKQGREQAEKIFRPLNVSKTIDNFNSFWIPAFAGMTKKNKARNYKFFKSFAQADKKNKKSTTQKSSIALWPIWQTLDQLAFVGLLKFLYAIFKKIFTWLYKICYAVGWVIMFVLRLVGLILLAIGRPIGKIMPGLLSACISAVAFTATLFKRFLPRGKFGVEIAKKKTDKIPPTPPYQSGQISGYLKPVLVFAGVLLMIVLPVKAYTYYKSLDSIKGKVLGESASAINDLIAGGQAAVGFDFNSADKSLSKASANFLRAQNQLNEINGLIFTLASLAPDKNLRLAGSAKDILRAGELSAEAGKNLSLAMSGLFNYQPSGNSKIFNDLSVYGHKTITNLTSLTEVLSRIDSGLIPEIYQKQFILLKQKTVEVRRGLAEFISLADSLESFLGLSADKRYLLVFQNNSELRASGGFIGSFALIDFSQGQIKNINVPGGGSYDTEAGLLKTIKSPEPLSLVRPDWHFWDANWWPDWPTSARKLAWFYENSDGSTVDGVLSFTPTVMERLLKIIGPIDMKEKYGLVFDADNFWPETQKLSEQKLDVTRQPKKIIGDLMNQLIKELPGRLNKDNLLLLFKAIEESLADKNILFYFTDEALQSKISSFGWDGRIKETNGDYLNVVNSNIAGQKTDREIKQEISHLAEVMPDGTIIDNLTVKRTHQGIKGVLFTGVRNVDWMRIYVPLGAELIEAQGFKPVDKIFFKSAEENWQTDQDVLSAEALAKTFSDGSTKIYNELGKTVFANWSQLDPGESIEIKLKYRLPFKLTDKKRGAVGGLAEILLDRTGELLNPEQKSLFSYSLLAQKQPGMNTSVISSELKLSKDFKPVWSYSDGSPTDSLGQLKSQIFDRDKIMAIMVEEK